MTVSYTAEVATCKGFGCFLKLLFRWRGSIYKLVWPDLFLFLGTYFSLSIIYRVFLTVEQQVVFEKVVRYCDKNGNLIPVSFVLGFYVSIVVGRWWDQYKSIPWTDSIAVFVSANIQGQEEKGRVMRRTIMRYCCLALTMTFTMISPRVKKRFPTMDHFIEAGLLLENEKEIIDDLNRQVPGYSKQWLPVIWASSIVTRARKEGKIRDDFAVKTILDELNKFRSGCGTLINYDWISVPLVYTQVVTLAVYSYFLACVMGRQWLRPDRDKGKSEDPEIDLIFPIFTTLQFFFYMGWLKVAESLVNPFGDDDDDFELNWMVDRNLQVSYLIVDEMHNNHPELLRDQYWDEVFPIELPHTVASEEYKEEPPQSSTANIHVSKDDGEIVSPPSVKSIFHMSESGIFMRKPKISVTHADHNDEETSTVASSLATTVPLDDINDNGHDSPISSSNLNGNNFWKRHPQLSRAVHSFPVRMGEQSQHQSLSRDRGSNVNYKGFNDEHDFGENTEGGYGLYEFYDGNYEDDYIDNYFVGGGGGINESGKVSSRRRHHSSEPGRRVSVAASKRGSIVGRRERTSSVRSTASQSTLAESVTGRMSHAGSVTSVFRRMFSRDKGDRVQDLNSPTEGPATGWAGSSINMRNVAEDVIPELDENMTTIVSMRGEKRKPPTVHEIFGTGTSAPTQASQPLDIPATDKQTAREQFFRPTQLSVSAPVGYQPPKLEGENKEGFKLSSDDETVEGDVEREEEEEDLSMDDIQTNNRRPSSNIAKKLAKTLGLNKGKDQEGDGDKSEVHLLSDVSKIKEDSEGDEDDSKKGNEDGK